MYISKEENRKMEIRLKKKKWKYLLLQFQNVIKEYMVQ